MDSEVGKRLQLLRTALNLKQKDIAKIAGISRQQISSVENGKDMPSYKLLRTVFLTYNVNPLWFFTGEGNMFDKKNITKTDGEELMDTFIKEYFPELPIDDRPVAKKILLEMKDPVMLHELRGKVELIRKLYEPYFEKKENKNVVEMI